MPDVSNAAEGDIVIVRGTYCDAGLGDRPHISFDPQGRYAYGIPVSAILSISKTSDHPETGQAGFPSVTDSDLTRKLAEAEAALRRAAAFIEEEAERRGDADAGYEWPAKAVLADINSALCAMGA